MNWNIWDAINCVANYSNILPINPSETGFRLLTGKKQLKGFVVLDYTRSLLEPVLNGDTNLDLKSDAAEAMEAAAKTLMSALPRDAQIGLLISPRRRRLSASKSRQPDARQNPPDQRD